MRSSFCLVVFLIGFLGISVNGAFQIGPPDASAAINVLKTCIDKCMTSGAPGKELCRQKKCSLLKNKADKGKCNQECSTSGGLLQFCDSSCKQTEVCLRGKEMKACLTKCSVYKKSGIHRYLSCRKEECTPICKP